MLLGFHLWPVHHRWPPTAYTTRPTPRVQVPKYKVFTKSRISIPKIETLSTLHVDTLDVSNSVPYANPFKPFNGTPVLSHGPLLAIFGYIGADPRCRWGQRCAHGPGARRGWSRDASHSLTLELQLHTQRL